MSVEVFRENAAGLFVPNALSREREVWTSDEERLLKRAEKLLGSRGISLFLGCTDARCRKEPIVKIQNADGGFTLQCAHKDRVFVKAL